MSELQLSKTIPARRKTVRFLWIKKDWMQFCKFKEARTNMKSKIIYEKCFWCRKPFTDDAMLNLAAPEKGRNCVLCSSCADECG